MTEGPFGFPMPDAVARAVEAVLRSLPAAERHGYRHRVTMRGPEELFPGDRADISWITTEAIDRAGDVVAARGMDDSQFRLNPVVTLNHDYGLPPVGRSSWRRRASSPLAGVRARTHYPPCPDGWPASQGWPPDQAFALVQAGLLAGKSIGFLPLEAHVPDEKEVRRRGWGEGVRLVIDRWLLLEYACVSLPANPLTLVESVSKGAKLPPFTPLDEVRRRIEREAEALDVKAMAARAVADALDRVRGRV